MRRAFPLLVLLVAAPVTHAESSVDRVRKDVFFLASDECEGRGLTTQGINKAADYIAAAFKQAGLKPAAADGSYFQPFTVKETFLEAGPHEFVLTGPAGKDIAGQFNKDFTVSGLSGKGTVGGGLVFVGYGIAADKKYDDFAGIDIKGKIVVVLRQVPRVKAAKDDKLFTDGEKEKYAPLQAKIEAVAKRGAAGLVFVSDRDMAGKEDPLMDYNYSHDSAKMGPMPIVHARRALIDRLLEGTGKTLGKIEADIDETKKPQSFAFEGWTVRLTTTVGLRELQVKNIVGYLEGSGPSAQETVVLGAHYDHLGRGEVGTKSLGSKDIHYGADDNASGTAALIELARRFGGQPNRSGRRLVFIAFSGEERGLKGSAYYCDKPLFPIKDTVAMLNMDMVGRLRPDAKTKKEKITIGGVGSAKSFEKLLDDANKTFDLQIGKVKSGTGPSDHTSFYIAKVPVYFFFTEDHPEYHTPKDKPETLNLQGIVKIADMVEGLTKTIATAKERPEYVAGMGGSPGMGVRSGPKLGLMPRYDDAETRGMEVEGVVPGGAAEAAGLKKGDRILSIGGKPVKNVQDYMKVMGGLQRGNPVELAVERDGKEIKVTATPK